MQSKLHEFLVQYIINKRKMQYSACCSQILVRMEYVSQTFDNRRKQISRREINYLMCFRMWLALINAFFACSLPYCSLVSIYLNLVPRQFTLVISISVDYLNQLLCRIGDQNASLLRKLLIPLG